MGAETRIFNPSGLPLPDDGDANHPKVQELREPSFAKAFMKFDDNDRMKPSPYHNRIMDVMEELMKFTILTRSCSDYLTDRYSERVESAEQLSARVNQRSI